jgi:hypothetical protein
VKKNKSYSLKILLLIITLLVFSSCSSINRNIYIVRDKSLLDTNLDVDLLATDDAKKSILLNNTSYSDYWTDNDIRKYFQIKEMYFKNNDRNILELSKKNKIWEKWNENDVKTLFIFANSAESMNGTNWKRKIPIERYSWFNFWSDKDLKITVSKEKISVK